MATRLSCSNTVSRIISLYIIFQLLRCCYGRSLCSIVNQRCTCPASAALIGDRLFFSSGNYTFDDDELGLHNTSSLYWLYLNKTIDLVHPIDASLLGSTALPDDSLTGGSQIYGDGGVFFYDRTSLYPYAGMAGAQSTRIDQALWSFNTTDDTWRLVQVQGSNNSFSGDTRGISASDPNSGMSFYTSRIIMGVNGIKNGITKFQSFNSDSPQWSSETVTSGDLGVNIQGAMVYLRKGKSGVLLAFGAYEIFGTDANSPDWDSPESIRDIFIYDISSNTWYLQTTSGDLPSPRSGFCAGVSAAPDDSSFQVTIHGGRDLYNLSSLNDVYVLSIPAFHWIQINDSNNPDLRGSDSPGRYWPKCDVFKETQLIVSGGFIIPGNSTDTILNDKCNKTYPPFKVLDTSTYTWRSNFDPNLEYTVPNSVTAIIGGESSGGATIKAPSVGWNSRDLEVIFGQTVPRDTYDRGNKIPGNETSASQTLSTQTPGTSDLPTTTPNPVTNNNLPTKAIAVIGTIVPLVVIATAIGVYIWLKRRKAKNIPKHPAESNKTAEKSNNQWHKPELDAHYTARYELDGLGPRPRELQGDFIQPIRYELPDSQRPAELE
ncbi:hypothetical protein M434DRAFT_31556 [Hypoxylon sp. CO27-5]|nr:hypothetical protein M434DRAFT_31556 [Hypoxylon sp. CO27-5]